MTIERKSGKLDLSRVLYSKVDASQEGQGANLVFFSYKKISPDGEREWLAKNFQKTAKRLRKRLDKGVLLW